MLVAVVHGELLALEPFASANGVVARAAARLAAISSGLDPRGLAVPEVGHLRARHGVPARRREGFAAGTPDGLAAWIRHCCDQWVAGAREGRSIADARDKMTGGGPPRGSPPADATIEIQACTTCRDGGLGVQRPGTQASRRHASRGVLCVECPIVAYEALIRVDGCFSAAPPLADQEFVGSL